MNTKKRKTIICRKNNFTLMEIMIVVGIIGLLMAIVGPIAAKALFKGQKGAVKMQIRAFDGAIMDYQLDTGGLPKSLNDLISNPGNKKWDGPYLKSKEIPKDPWSNDYVYRLDGNAPSGYIIISYGSDGSPGGTGKAKDITSED